jgi:hypothetical protein
MLNFNDFQDIISNKSFDEQSEDMMSFLNVSNFHFEDCFTKIFSKNNLIDIDLDNEAENKTKNPIKNESNYSFSSKEKSYENTNLLNLNEDNSEKTIDKSKETSQKNENLNEKSDVSNLSSINHIDEEKNNCSSNKLIISLSDDDLKQSQIEDKGSDTLSFLGKKRVLFEDYSPKDYSIFNYGEKNDYSKQIINEVLNEILELDNKKMREMMNGEHQKKVYKKRKNIPKRKDNSDNIRKKVKSRFLKVLKNVVNEKLKLAGSKKFFNFLPQTFVSNVSKDKNKDMFDSTFKDIFTRNFCEDKDGNQPDVKKYHHNLSVIEYLENNKEIAEKSNYNNFKNMKFYQIFYEYLKSKEFEFEIVSLKMERENEKYIREYIFKACNFIEFLFQ